MSSTIFKNESDLSELESLVRKIELLETKNQFLLEANGKIEAENQFLQNENGKKSKLIFLIFELGTFEYVKWIEEQNPNLESTQTTKHTVCLETSVYIMLKTFQKLTNISIKEIISEALFLFIKGHCFQTGNEDLRQKVFIDANPLSTYKTY